MTALAHAAVWEPAPYQWGDLTVPGPTVIGGSPDCRHVWGQKWRPGSNGESCAKCGAWRGAFGVQSSPSQYAAHVVAVAESVRSRLRPSGHLVLRLRDSRFGEVAYRTSATAIARAANDLTKLHTDHASCRPLSQDYNLVGLSGEFEFCREFGYVPDLSVRPAGDLGSDFRTPAGAVDIKTARKPKNLPQEVNRKPAHILVLAGYSDETQTARLIGWEYGEVMLRQPTREFGYGIVNHCKLAGDLRPIAELKALCGVTHWPGDWLDIPGTVAAQLSAAGWHVRGRAVADDSVVLTVTTQNRSCYDLMAGRRANAGPSDAIEKFLRAGLPPSCCRCCGRPNIPGEPPCHCAAQPAAPRVLFVDRGGRIETDSCIEYSAETVLTEAA